MSGGQKSDHPRNIQISTLSSPPPLSGYSTSFISLDSSLGGLVVLHPLPLRLLILHPPFPVGFILEGSVADPDPFPLGQPDPDPFYEEDLGNKKSAKIMENSHKNQTKPQEYHILSSKILMLCLMDIYIYLKKKIINIFFEKDIFEVGSDPDPHQVSLALGRKIN